MLLLKNALNMVIRKINRKGEIFTNEMFIHREREIERDFIHEIEIESSKSMI